MTLSELRTMVRSLIGYDLEGAAATDADLDTLINRAYQQQAARVGAAQMAQVSVLANQAEVSVPGLVRLDRCWWQVGSSAPVRVWPASPAHDWSMVDVGTPRWFRCDGNSLRLYPAPAEAGTLLIRGVFHPAPLSANLDTPYTPQHLHPAIAYRAAAEWALRYNHAKAQPFMMMAQEIESVGRAERFGNALHALDGVPR
jgi:hypothetical protein